MTPPTPPDPAPLRLRMKVWTHPTTGKRYLASAAFGSRVKNVISSEIMFVYVMSDEDTQIIQITAEGWNNLPFFYFKEDGEAAKPEKAWTPDPIGGGPISPQ